MNRYTAINSHSLKLDPEGTLVELPDAALLIAVMDAAVDFKLAYLRWRQKVLDFTSVKESREILLHEQARTQTALFWVVEGISVPYTVVSVDRYDHLFNIEKAALVLRKTISHKINEAQSVAALMTFLDALTPGASTKGEVNEFGTTVRTGDENWG